MRMNGYARLFIWLMLAMLALCFGANAELTMDCTIGYDDAITYCRTLPINVTLTGGNSNESGLLSVDVQIDDSQYDRFQIPVTVAAGATVKVMLPVFLCKKQDTYLVQWIVDGKAERQLELKPGSIINPGSLIVGVLSDNPRNLSSLSISKSSDPLARGEYWQTVALTRDTFPSTLNAMRFFDILAVDGEDMTLLNAEQKAAFDGWLKDGGVVLVGGGAQAGASFPFFTQYTGLSAGALSEEQDPTEELMELFNLKLSPLGQDVMRIELKGATGTSVGKSKLIDIFHVRNGSIFTASFSLSDKPFSAWQGRNALWQRLLIKYMQFRYQGMVEQRSNNYGYASSNVYSDISFTDDIAVENGHGMGLPIMLLVVFVLLCGFGSYLILSKLDKREWMWLTVPVLSIGFSLLMWGISGPLGMKTPIAVSYTVVNVDEDGTQTHRTMVSAARADVGRLTVSSDNGHVNLLSSIPSYYDASDEKMTSKTLRYQYTYGDRDTLTMPEGDAWQAHSFVLDDVPIANCELVGSCSQNNGCFDFTITNNGDAAFHDGVIFSEYGYIGVPALLPGQTVTASLVPPEDPKKADRIVEGVLLTEQQRRSASYYDYAELMTKAPKDRQESEEEHRDRMNRRSVLASVISSLNWGGSENVFRYIGFCDTLADPHIRIDGNDALRSANCGCVDLSLNYQPVSKDGTLHFLKGGFPLFMAAVEDDGTPVTVSALGSASSRYNYYSLNSKPCFAFDMSALPADTTITSMDISVSYTYYSYEIEAYNQKTKKWDVYKTYDFNQATNAGTSRSRVLRLEDYLDANDLLFVRFKPYGQEDGYAEIGLPNLTLDGSAK